MCESNGVTLTPKKHNQVQGEKILSSSSAKLKQPVRLVNKTIEKIKDQISKTPSTKINPSKSLKAVRSDSASKNTQKKARSAKKRLKKNREVFKASLRNDNKYNEIVQTIDYSINRKYNAAESKEVHYDWPLFQQLSKEYCGFAARG